MNIIDPYVRSAIYKELSDLYQYPGPEAFAQLKSKLALIADALKAYAAENRLLAPTAGDVLANSMAHGSLEEIQVEYVRLFDYRPPCPPYESAIVKMARDNPARLHLLLEAFYNEFGLVKSAFFADPPDHISLELEFMHYLSHKEGEGLEKSDPAAVERFWNGQKRFLEAHIMEWVPVFSARLQNKARGLFYKNLGLITHEFVTADSGYLASLQMVA